jgi:hypothetical protein
VYPLSTSPQGLQLSVPSGHFTTRLTAECVHWPLHHKAYSFVCPQRLATLKWTAPWNWTHSAVLHLAQGMKAEAISKCRSLFQSSAECSSINGNVERRCLQLRRKTRASIASRRSSESRKTERFIITVPEPHGQMDAPSSNPQPIHL